LGRVDRVSLGNSFHYKPIAVRGNGCQQKMVAKK
jgi:hypothetical protein